MAGGGSSEGSSEKIIDELLKGTSRSFYLTLKVLPKKVRRQIGLAYLLARLADTIADSKVGENKVLWKLLAEYNHRLLHGECVDMPDFTELAVIQEDSAESRLLNEAFIPVNYLEKSQYLSESDRKKIIQLLNVIISGQILDLERFNDASGRRIISLKNEEELDSYTYLVAGSVGEFWTHMSLDHLFSLEEERREILFDKAVKFGKSLQLINILRDLPEDLRMGRCYIPIKSLKEIEMTAKDLLDMNNIGKFRPLYDSYIDRAEDYLDEAVDYVKMLPRSQFRLRLSCLLPILIGQRTLQLLRERNILDIENRIKVLRPEIRKIMRKAMWLSITGISPKKMN
tara:strand:- start:27 stop:1052 length:1026 start_codon:yes stop_codon:yes gene_type:complete